MGPLPEWATIAVMMNNYLHDVATALLAASAVVMLVLSRTLDDRPSPGAADFVVRLYPRITALAKAALVWILVGGIVRTVFFTRVELVQGVGVAGITAALLAKHVIMIGLVIWGAAQWRRLARRYQQLKGSPIQKKGS